MIKIEDIDVWGFAHAIRGMRNPINSWEKSDSKFVESIDFDPEDYAGGFRLGENDLNLMRRLINAGPDHRKFMRQIEVSMDITAPLYWWKEFDTYKVGTVANSCSTMHKIHAETFTENIFSWEHITGTQGTDYIVNTLNHLNYLRDKYLETKDKDYWYQMIQALPSSYNQKRTVTLNYEVLLNMYKARQNHKLDEWREFCNKIEDLPYFTDLIE